MLDKVFERCVQKQLVHYFNPYLSKFWSAYRKGYSCKSVLLHLIEDWKGALDKNSVVGTVMDLSKAFDTTRLITCEAFCLWYFYP